jgi:hypothetical protein
MELNALQNMALKLEIMLVDGSIKEEDYLFLMDQIMTFKRYMKSYTNNHELKWNEFISMCLTEVKHNSD